MIIIHKTEPKLSNYSAQRVCCFGKKKRSYTWLHEIEYFKNHVFFHFDLPELISLFYVLRYQNCNKAVLKTYGSGIMFTMIHNSWP